MKYKLVIEERADLLEKSVQDLIDEGWAPLGGASVCVTNNGRGCDSYLHQQAMTFIVSNVKLRGCPIEKG